MFIFYSTFFSEIFLTNIETLWITSNSQGPVLISEEMSDLEKIKRKLTKYCFSLLLEFMPEPLFIFPNYINVTKYFPTKYYQPPWNTTSDSSNSTRKTTLGRTCKSWRFCLQQSCWHRFLLTQPGSSGQLWRGSQGHGLAQEVAPQLLAATTSLQFSWINPRRAVLSSSA